MAESAVSLSYYCFIYCIIEISHKNNNYLHPDRFPCFRKNVRPWRFKSSHSCLSILYLTPFFSVELIHNKINLECFFPENNSLSEFFIFQFFNCIKNQRYNVKYPLRWVLKLLRVLHLVRMFMCFLCSTRRIECEISIHLLWKLNFFCLREYLIFYQSFIESLNIFFHMLVQWIVCGWDIPEIQQHLVICWQQGFTGLCKLFDPITSEPGKYPITSLPPYHI